MVRRLIPWIIRRVAPVGLVLAAGLVNGSIGAQAGALADFDALWNYDHPDSTEIRFRALLPAARDSGDSDYLIQLLTQIARAEGLQRKFREADRTLDEAQSLLRGDFKKADVRVHLERGRVLNSSGKPEEAKALFARAWDLARDSGEDNLAIDAAHMVAIVESPEASIEWNNRALQLAESSSDPEAGRWLGSLYNNLGWTFHDRGEYQRALELFQKAWDWRRGQKQERETLIAKWCVARALRSLQRPAEALAMQEELAREWTTVGEEDGYVSEELGECLLALGRAADAKPHFARAFELLSKDPWLTENEPERLSRISELGGIAAR